MFALSHWKDSNLTESAKLKESATCWWKTRLFRSFQIIQTQHNHIILRNKWAQRGSPVKWPKWSKWLRISMGGTKYKWSHCKTKNHARLKMSQVKNRWSAVSIEPQPDTHEEFVVELSCLWLKVYCKLSEK